MKYVSRCIVILPMVISFYKLKFHKVMYKVVQI